MPKTKTRKRGASTGSPRTQTMRPSQEVTTRNDLTIKQKRATNRQNSQSMIMAALVALGCWGMAFSFVVFTNDPNRFLFGGMAALMALMWTISFGVRLRKQLRS